MKQSVRLTVGAIAIFALTGLRVHAQTILNPSFEQNTFTVAPGYCSLNGGSGAITGWSLESQDLSVNPAGYAGLNSAGGVTAFWDNGMPTQGTHVAFIQPELNGIALRTTITGLIPGTKYALTCRVNSRAGLPPNTFATPQMDLVLNFFDAYIDVPFVVPPVGAWGDYSIPYRLATDTFVSTQSSVDLYVWAHIPPGTDGALLLDDFRISALPASLWSVSAWTNDVSTGVSTNQTLCAYHFASDSPITINGVTFLGANGVNPSVAGSFAVAGEQAGYANPFNSLTGTGSQALAGTCIFGGNPGTLTLQGLTEGSHYRVSLFGVGYDAPGNRNVVFSGGGDLINVDEDRSGRGNGVRVDYTFFANATNNVITLTPFNAGNTFNLYGFALNAVPTAPSILTQPVNQSQYASRSASFTLTCVGTPLPSCQWYGPGNSLLAGATNYTLSLSGVTTGTAGNYFAILTNASGAVTSSIVTLTVNPATPITLVPTTLADGGPGSFRQVLLDALSGDTIVITNSGTLTLTNELVLNKNLTIVGPGASQFSFSGNHACRVFNVASNSTVSISGLTICNGKAPDGANGPDNVYIQNVGGCPGGDGGDGGGIFNLGTLTLSNCVITANAAGNGGKGGDPNTITTYNGDSGGNGGHGGHGGGLYNAGSLLLTTCTVTACIPGVGGNGGNGADASSTGTGAHGGHGGNAGNGGNGGAIYSDGPLTLTACTVSANLGSAGGGGGKGGVNLYGLGGSGGAGGRGGDAAGICCASSCQLTDCTINGNISNSGGPGGAGGVGNVSGSAGSAGSVGNIGGIYSSGSLALTACTVSANNTAGSGGGVFSVGSTTVRDSLIALNTAAASPDVAGNFTSQGHNLVGRSDGSAGFTNAVNADLVGSAASPLNPLLSPLANNGGPTFTMALRPGSPAIDAGDDSLLNAPSNLAFDQLGLPRRRGSHVDIGAVEAGAGLPLISSQPQDLIAPFGSTAPLTVAAASPASCFFGALPLTYQWQKNGLNLTEGGNVAGSGNSNLVLSSVCYDDAGSYQVIVTNFFGSVTSRVAQLAISISRITNGSSVVVNGGFETGNFTGWTVENFHGVNIHSTLCSAQVTSGQSQSGSYSAFFQGPGSLPVGDIKQTVVTQPGMIYWLSFWLFNSVNGVEDQFQVVWNGASVYTTSNIAYQGWSSVAFPVVATGTNSVLQFNFLNNYAYGGLDEVRLEPSTFFTDKVFLQAATQTNGALQFGWTTANTVPPMRYQLQCTTNLAATNWINVGDVIPTASVTLSVTNLGTAQQRYYRVQLVR
jgi:hypothetical protein